MTQFRRAMCCAIVAWIALGLPMPARAQATPPSEEILFVGPSDEPPFFTVDETGKPRGYTVELLRALAREAGVTVTFKALPRHERRLAFSTGEAALADVGVNTMLARLGTPVVPLWHVRRVALYQEQRQSPPRSLADLADETVSVVESSAAHYALMDLPEEARPQLVLAVDNAEALRNVRKGRAAFAVGNSMALRAVGEYRTAPRLSEAEIESIPYYVAAAPGHEHLQEIFAAAYLRLQESGELTAIIERTLVAESKSSRADRWASYIIAFTVFAAVALLGMFVWSRSLQAQVRRRTREIRALGERQAFQAHVLSQVTDAIVVTDRSGQITSWNAGATALFARTEADVIGRPVTEIITPRVGGARDGDLRVAIAEGGEWTGDAEILRPGGGSVFVDASVRGILDERGVPQGHLIVAHDIDMRQRAELESRQRARQQSAIASLGQRALAGIDFQWLVDQATSVTRSTLNVSAAAVFDRTDGDAWLTLRAGEGWEHGEIGGIRFENLAFTYPGFALAAGMSTVVCDHRDEQRFAIDPYFARELIITSAAVAIPGRAGAYGVLLVGDRRERAFSRDDRHFLQAVANVIGAAFARAAIDRELRSELALHSATLESTAEGIFVTDEAGRVTRYNQRMIEMWGYPPEVLASDNAEDWVRWATQLVAEPELRFDDFRRAALSDRVATTVITMNDGRVFERHSQPQRVDGRVVGHVWCYRDVTERVRTEEERRRLESQMQHVQKLESLGVLAGGIAHDFNNLLVGILGNAGLALIDAPPDSPVRARIKHIEVAAQRAAELTNQMLAYSGKGHFIMRHSDLSELVKEMVDLLRTAVTKTAQLDVHLAVEPVAFDGDPAQIRQVIMNLITNASDAIGDAPGRIEVRTGRMMATREYLVEACVGDDQPEGEFVFAEVHDDGCGMDAATRARIFDPFFTTKFTGRGLGLAAVLGIVRGHGGAIKITTGPRKGTTFRVLLPATTARLQRAEPQHVSPPMPAAASVLVVDDEPSVRRVASEVLSRAGFTVTVAGDGEEALEIVRARAGEFDAVLLDMTMPRMSGVETFRVLRELHPSLRVVLTSGYSQEDAAARFGGDGLAGFIQKPFLPQALVLAMSGAVSRPEEVAQ